MALLYSEVVLQSVCLWEAERKKERKVMKSAPDSSFDGDGEEEGFWHERGQCVIIMSL